MTQAAATRIARGALVVLPAAIALWAVATCAFSRGVHEARFGHDVFLPLDGAWRLLSGQTQHVDFYSPYGPVETSVVAWFMRLGGATPLAIPRAVAFIGAVAAAAMLAAALGRASSITLAWLVAVVALTAVGRNQLGFSFHEVSHSAYYNRIGFALLAAVAVECLLAPAAGARRVVVLAGGALSGFLVSLLLFVKLTFPLAGAVFLAMSAVFVERSRSRTIAMAGGALAGLVAGGALIGFHYGAMLGDYAFIAAARRTFALASTPPQPSAALGFFHDTYARDTPVLTPGRIAETLVNEACPALLVGALALVAPRDALRAEGRGQLGALVAMTWVVSLGLVLTSWQWGDSPLFAVLALVLADYAWRSPERSWRHAACAALATASVAGFAGKQIVSVAYDNAWQAAYHGRADTLPGLPAARGLVVEGSDSACRPLEYGARLAAALDVIRTIPDPRVVNLDFSNPYPFLLGATPPEGGGVCWHHQSTFSDEVHLSSEAMLGGANVVVVPRCAEDTDATQDLDRIYGAVLRRDFEVVKDLGALLVLRRVRSEGHGG